LWLKESVLDKRHFGEGFLDSIKLGKLCPEDLKTDNAVGSINYKLLKKSFMMRDYFGF